MCCNSIGGQYTGCLMGKSDSVAAAVVRNGHMFRKGSGIQIIGQALRGLADCIKVDSIGAGA